MRPTLHKFLNCSLLAIYASVSLLGEGLHWFLPHEHHHHGSMVVTCTTHHHAHKHDVHCCDHHPNGPCCHHFDHEQDHDDEHVPAGPVVAARDGDTHSHACQICEYLFQAVSQPPQVATTPDLHPLVANATCREAQSYLPAILGLHAARGPPRLLT